MPILGLTFDEKTYAPDFVGSLEKLLQQGWKGMEFAPDPSLMQANDYKQLILKLSSNDGRFSFHVPNFISNKVFNPAAFGTSIQLIDNFTNLFELCSWLCEYAPAQNIDSPTVLVLHGAEFELESERKAMSEKTLRFLDWATNEVIKRKHPFVLTLENAFSPRHSTVGDSLESIHSLFEQLQGYPLGLCLDLPHLKAKSGQTLSQVPLDSNQLITDEWLKQHLLHVHIHGYRLDPYVSHLPLCNPDTNNLDFADTLAFLDHLNYSGLVIEEVLGLGSENALACTHQDFQLLAKLASQTSKTT